MIRAMRGCDQDGACCDNCAVTKGVWLGFLDDIGAASLNITMLLATDPVLTGLMQVMGLKRTMIGCLLIPMSGYPCPRS